MIREAENEAAGAYRVNPILQEAEIEAVEQRSKRQWALGIFFIVLVSVLWAAGSIIVQFIADDIGYNQPFVFTYICSAVMTFFVPSYLGLAFVGLAHNPPFRDRAGTASDDRGPAYKELAGREETEDDHEADITVVPGCTPQGGLASPEHDEVVEMTIVPCCNPPCGLASPEDDDEAEITMAPGSNPPDRSPEKPRMRSHLFMLKAGLCVSLVWFFAQWTYNTSLAYTSVTSSTIIANSSALFTYLFSVVARTERFTKTKTVGVALALLGAVMVGLGDKEDGDSAHDSLWGDAAALMSAVGYGVYSTILTILCPSDDEVSMSLVLGYLGVASALIFLPLVVGLAYAPGMHILHGLTFHIVQLIVFKAVMDNVISGLLWARAILLTTPTVATVGCSLTIPIAFMSDFAMHGKVPNPLAVLGAFLVVGGFYFVSDREGGGVGGGSSDGGGACCNAAGVCPTERNFCLRRTRAKSDES
ncbi:unnamed protein product [Ectocarpus sp. 13 AM-2016]